MDLVLHLSIFPPGTHPANRHTHTTMVLMVMGLVDAAILLQQSLYVIFCHLYCSRLTSKLLDDDPKSLRVHAVLAHGNQDGELLAIKPRIQQARHFVHNFKGLSCLAHDTRWLRQRFFYQIWGIRSMSSASGGQRVATAASSVQCSLPPH